MLFRFVALFVSLIQKVSLFQVVPSYNHVCASSQAGNVFMLEELAALLEQSDPNAATAAKLTAGRIANLTLGLYEPTPGGAFSCMDDTGARTQVRHVIDTVYTSWRMGAKLPGRVRAKMAQFAREELLTHNWMRALSTHDALHHEPRPDWGTSGVYDAMPALLAEALSFLEADFALPVEWLRNISALAQEGPFGQAHAIPQSPSQPAFKPLQGFIMYNSVCSGTFAVALIRSVFGWRGADEPLWQPALGRGGFVGTLSGLRTPEGLGTLVANDTGVYRRIKHDEAGGRDPAAPRLEFSPPVRVGKLLHRPEMYGLFAASGAAVSPFFAQTADGMMLSTSGGRTFTRASPNASDPELPLLASNLVPTGHNGSLHDFGNSTQCLRDFGEDHLCIARWKAAHGSDKPTFQTLGSPFAIEWDLQDGGLAHSVLSRPVSFGPLPNNSHCANFACPIRLQGCGFVSFADGEMIQTAMLSTGAGADPRETIIALSSRDGGFVWRTVGEVATPQQYPTSGE